MADKVVLNKSTITGIGNAIRLKEGSTAKIPTKEMEQRILNIKSGMKLIFTSQINSPQEFGIPNFKRDTVYLFVVSDEDDFSFTEYPDPNCCVIYTYSFTGDDFARATLRDGGLVTVDVINDEVYITDAQYQGYLYIYEL